MIQEIASFHTVNRAHDIIILISVDIQLAIPQFRTVAINIRSSDWYAFKAVDLSSHLITLERVYQITESKGNRCPSLITIKDNAKGKNDFPLKLLRK